MKRESKCLIFRGAVAQCDACGARAQGVHMGTAAKSGIWCEKCCHICAAAKDEPKKKGKRR